ncbi:MAG: nuclear transport factor 2 family protein [Calothrix sp. MO_192.B10]|nr:nuclear transport factor 2 family protein [Calothrix sp. MO_192.B10]
MNPSTNSNQETLHALQQAYSQGNLDAALACMDKNIIWDISGPASIPYTGVYYGHVGFSAFWTKLGQSVAIGKAGIHEQFFNGDTAVAIGGEEGTVRGNSVPYHYDWAVFYRFNADHKIVVMRQYYDPSRIQAALKAEPYPQSKD